jgi:hypothetical protein
MGRLRLDRLHRPAAACKPAATNEAIELVRTHGQWKIIKVSTGRSIQTCVRSIGYEAG